MNLLADECCEASVVDAIRDDGHEVVFAAETLRRLSDEDLLRRAADERRILLTEDKDFGELVYRLRRPSHGVILLRFAEKERDAKTERLRRLLSDRGEELYGQFVVLGIDKLRIRPLRPSP